jgi:predicted glycogen debranching enzyme
MTQPIPLTAQEWLEADGLGGFASGTVSGVRTRRYHALLGPAGAPPGGRRVLVNGFDAFVETGPGVHHAISSQRYLPDALHPDGWARLEEFSATPWPRWLFRLDSRLAVEQQLVVERGTGRVALSFALRGRKQPATLLLRPLLSGRDHHSLQRENGIFRFEATISGDSVEWHPYEGVPPVVIRSNGSYCPDPQWYRDFLYEEERARGYDCTESLASPGIFRFDLAKGEAWCVLAAGGIDAEAPAIFRSERRRRARLRGPLGRAADAYVVSRGEGTTVVAGYPWFGEWGRDTFVALRGLCLATGRAGDARDILLQWTNHLSEGMLPNRFPEGGGPPEYDSVDASLWFAVAVGDLLRTKVPAKDRRRLLDAVEAIIEGYANGTRHGIRLDDDGLLAAGAPGKALTWMGERTGKPVEVQELWFRTLEVSGRHGERLARGLASLRAKFWDAERSRLFDVVDADHVAGKTDARFRPNQIFAASRLPRAKARAVVDAVEASLWTPAGLRSLAPDEPQYRGRCEGGAEEREAAATLGTVWPWLAGPFVEAWLHVRGNGAAAKRQARARFLEPLMASIGASGIGHLPEIADGDPPHASRGCPFQAWSVGEALRLDRQILR